MTTCELIPQAVQFGGRATTEDTLAIVPDIHSSLFGGSDLQSCKRNRTSASDCLSIEGELNLLEPSQLSDFSFPEPKRHCSDYRISASPGHFQSIGSPDSIEEFALEVKTDYSFTESKDVFTCGGNSPVNSSTSVSEFPPANTQASTSCQQQDFDLQSFVYNMHRPTPAALTHPLAQHADKYELVITEQPEEVGIISRFAAFFFFACSCNTHSVSASIMTSFYATILLFFFCSITELATTVKE